MTNFFNTLLMTTGILILAIIVTLLLCILIAIPISFINEFKGGKKNDKSKSTRHISKK